MTHSGQGDERRHAARPAHEGVVLPGDGSEPWIPGAAADQAAPTGGQPWGQPWGPQDGHQERAGYDASQGGAPGSYGSQSGGQSYGQPEAGPSYGQPEGGQSYGAPLPPAQGQPYQHGGQFHQSDQFSQGQPLPAEAPLPGSADATQYLPPVPAMGDADATQYIAPVPHGPGQGHGPGMPPPESAAEATQFLPSALSAPQGTDADATQYIAPIPAQDAPAAPPGAPFGIRPGAPGERQPPAEFDSLFRTDGPGGPGQGGASTQQLPQFDAGRAPQPYRQQPAAPYEPQQRAAYAPPGRAPQEPQGRAGGRRKSSRLPLIAGVVVGCAVLGLGAGALMSGGDDTSPADDSAAVASASSQAAEPPADGAADPAKPQAEALDKLLADSNSSRAAVIRAVNDIKTCQNLDQAATDLRGAAEQRRGLVTKLKDLTIDQLPGNGELASSLTDAWQASASADDHYAQWADQAKSRKVCKDGHVRRTQQAAQGDRASGEATAAKKKASGLWNGIATKYGLSQRDQTQL
ncbi:hypothetical protein [Streptomyces sp. AK02-01A]|uniref:hypothetical protein n=1 Tax=Streptomyces sp. AK02-01A TaxID=3028648 RepID=UPI0029A10B20|nr:hypothetical protein [Streptomyces sp. AK02-01A]MDX3854619.1 hypothetical protein [Streptomyces sp. AK02-01A]